MATKRPKLTEGFAPVHRTLIEALRTSEDVAAKYDKDLDAAARRVETLMAHRAEAHETVAAHKKAIKAGKWSIPEGFDQFGDALPTSEPIPDAV